MQATKAVKGTLNKLTPEKFERLLQQLVDVVTSAEILHTTISLVFESAVAQPTFVAMYADLCDRLSKVCHARPFFKKSSKVACCVSTHTWLAQGLYVSFAWPRARRSLNAYHWFLQSTVSVSELPHVARVADRSADGEPDLVCTGRCICMVTSLTSLHL